MNLIPFVETYTERCPKCLASAGWRKYWAEASESNPKEYPERLDVTCIACGYYFHTACADAKETA